MAKIISLVMQLNVFVAGQRFYVHGKYIGMLYMLLKMKTSLCYKKKRFLGA